jgi:hypothetical protein
VQVSDNISCSAEDRPLRPIQHSLHPRKHRCSCDSIPTDISLPTRRYPSEILFSHSTTSPIPQFSLHTTRPLMPDAVLPCIGNLGALLCEGTVLTKYGCALAPLASLVAAMLHIKGITDSSLVPATISPISPPPPLTHSTLTTLHSPTSTPDHQPL